MFLPVARDKGKREKVMLNSPSLGWACLGCLRHPQLRSAESLSPNRPGGPENKDMGDFKNGWQYIDKLQNEEVPKIQNAP